MFVRSGFFFLYILQVIKNLKKCEIYNNIIIDCDLQEQ
jgi:hypothetical protein